MVLLSAAVALCQSPDDRLRELVARAQDAERRENLHEAERLYKEVLTIRPHWASAELNLGLVYYSQRKYREAIDVLGEALRHDGNLTSAHLFRGASYHHSGAYREAVQALDLYLKSEPESAEALSHLASAHYQLNDYARAALHYAAQLRQGNDANLYFHLAESYLQLSRQSMKRLSDDPKAKYFYLILSAEELLSAADRELAGRQIREAIALRPQAPEAQASLRRHEGGPSDDCREAPAAYADALCRARQGEFAAATKALLAAAPATEPRHTYWSFRIAKQLGQAAVNRLGSAAPGSALLLLIGAQIDEQNGNDEAAGQAYRRALETGGADLEARVRYGKFLCKLGRFDEAAPLYEQALSMEPRNPRLMALLGEMHATQGREEKALPYLRGALETVAGDSQSRLYLAQCLIRLGQTAEAVSVLEAAPDDPDGRLHYLLGTSYQKLGETEKARKALAISQERKKSVQQ
ncbi:MAG: tetratricopeptide repeat protein [Bryobacteraceae bacterium]